MKLIRFILRLLKMLFRQSKKAPIVIWYHNGATDTTESLHIALASGIPNHVMIYARHPREFDWRTDILIIMAIAIVKASPAKLIWSRCLWPYWDQSEITAEHFFDPEYYIDEIAKVRREAQHMDADFIALDIEAYGDSIMKTYMHRGDWLTVQQQARLQSAIDEAIATQGKVNFIYPAGNYRRPAAPWNIMSGLGENRISEDTYYSNPERIASITYPYEIFGAYLNIVKDRPGYPDRSYYLVPEIFDRAELWAGKDLFLYPKEGSALVVAKELLTYSKTLSSMKRR